MALRRLSRQSTWGLSSPQDNSPRTLYIAAFVILLVGVLAGYVIRGVGDSSSPTAAPNKPTSTDTQASTSVINPALAGIDTAGQTQGGAVKAATSFISGFTELALKSGAEQREVLSSILDPTADPKLTTGLLSTLTLGKQRLQTGTGPITAKLLTAPISYKVTMQGDDRATVVVWYVTVYLDSNGSKLEATWANAEVSLHFTDKWRIVTFVPKDGPTPPVYAGQPKPSVYNDVVPLLQGGSAYRSALARDE